MAGHGTAHGMCAAVCTGDAAMGADAGGGRCVYAMAEGYGKTTMGADTGGGRCVSGMTLMRKE